MKLSTAFAILAICAAIVVAFPVDSQGQPKALVRRTPGGDGSHDEKSAHSEDDDDDNDNDNEEEKKSKDKHFDDEKPKEKKGENANPKKEETSTSEEEKATTSGKPNESENGQEGSSRSNEKDDEASDKGNGDSNFSKKATYYNPSAGVGACGIHYSDNEMIAAISASEFDESKCGQEITVKGPTGTTTVKIGDSCPGCDSNHIDLSPAANAKINSNYEVDGVTKVSF
ncbi:hypothetical protein H4R35_006207 [Dimargaris xerosporica]|nr:hypothetical protein H4R35_006207 [Dimargaris xerosporica]